MMTALTLSQMAVAAPAPESQKISRPGIYSGWSKPRFDGWQMTSRYVAMRDGTKIAIDVIRPTYSGKVVTAPLPVLWMNTPYDRRRFEDGFTARDYPGAALALVKFGYVVAIADMRGNYASFGRAIHSNRNEWTPWAYWDAYDITEWLAAQPWSDGKIGMWGCSATGHSQWQAAATNPPHLKAIFPMSAPSEYYDWGGIVPAPGDGPPPRTDERKATPVDSDQDGSLVAAAEEEHRGNLEPGYMPFRDSPAPELAASLGWHNYRYWLEVNTYTHFKDIAASGVAAYQTANYGEDIRVKQGVFVKRANLPNPMKTILAPGNHCEWTSDFAVKPGNSFNINVEELRWFDHWLKGIPNGVMKEPPVLYYTINAPVGDEWRQAWQWPVPTEQRVEYYLAAGVDGREGALSTDMPRSASGGDLYSVDYSVDEDNIDQKGQIYTSPQLAEDMTLTGHTIVHIWVSSTADDGDFIVWLEDVAADGAVTRLPGSEDGRLRASHRALAKAPYTNLGLPYHRSFAADMEPLVPGKPTELVIDLAPVSYVFKKGHRLRLAIAGVASARHGGHIETPILTPPPVVTFLRDATHPSRIDLPISRPIAAKAAVAISGEGMDVELSFPSQLDKRYLDDVRPEAIRLGHVVASSVEHNDGKLIAHFKQRQPLGPAVLSGCFGGEYSYGEDACFTANVKPKR